MKKQKIIEILITALLSAGIAFLQSVLVSHGNTGTVETSTATAGVIGGTISTIRKFIC